jgi:WD40 repeat protein
MGSNVLGFFGTNILCRWDRTNQILIDEWDGEKFMSHGAITVDSGVRPNGIAFNPARQLVAWTEGTNSTSVYLVSLAARGRRIELKSDIAGMIPLSFSEDGNQLMAETSGRDSLRIWKVETGQVVMSLNQPIEYPIFAAHGRTLVAGMPVSIDNYEIAFYDLTRPEEAPRLIPGKEGMREIAVSPDGRLVATCDEGGKVRLFDPARRELIEIIDAHINSCFDIAFSPDGRRLISTHRGLDAVKLWDVGTRQELLTLSGIGQVLFQAAWTADGDSILAGGTWQAWRAPSWDEINAVEAKERSKAKSP